VKCIKLVRVIKLYHEVRPAKHKILRGVTQCDNEFSDRNSLVFQINLLKAAGASTKLRRMTFQKTFLLFRTFVNATYFTEPGEERYVIKQKEQESKYKG
jgi:hypothetical protein